MANQKTFTAREAAIAVLAKAQELLAKSELVKAETGHEKGIHTQSDPSQRSRVMMGTSKAGSQMPFSRNSPSQRMEDRAESKQEHKKVIGEMHAMPKPNLPKSEMAKGGNSPAPMLAMSEKNPDEKQDAKLGEEVEGLCERHMMDNKDAERKEGHKIVKSESCKMCKSGMQKSEFAELYEDLQKMEKAEGVDENEIGTKFQKAEEKGQGAGNKEAPSNPMKPRIKEEGTERDYNDFETKPGHAAAPDHREASTMKPGANPKEQAEGNNSPAGSAPGSHEATGAISGKGVHKLSHFCGHLSAKKGMKKGIALG